MARPSTTHQPLQSLNCNIFSALFLLQGCPTICIPLNSTVARFNYLEAYPALVSSVWSWLLELSPRAHSVLETKVGCGGISGIFMVWGLDGQIQIFHHTNPQKLVTVLYKWACEGFVRSFRDSVITQIHHGWLAGMNLLKLLKSRIWTKSKMFIFKQKLQDFSIGKSYAGNKGNIRNKISRIAPAEAKLVHLSEFLTYFILNQLIKLSP